MKLTKLCLVAMVAVAVIAAAGVVMAGTLDEVRAKGFIQAGVNGGVYGFSMPDEKGVWKGLDVDTARAIAAAVFGDADKVIQKDNYQNYVEMISEPLQYQVISGADHFWRGYEEELAAIVTRFFINGFKGI